MNARAVVDRVAEITKDDVERLASHGMEGLSDEEFNELFELLFDRWDLREIVTPLLDEMCRSFEARVHESKATTYCAWFIATWAILSCVLEETIGPSRAARMREPWVTLMESGSSTAVS